MKSSLKILSVLIFLGIFAFTSCGSSSAGGNTPANSSSKTLTSFSIVTPSTPGTIDESSKTVSITVPYGTDITKLVANFTTTGDSTTIGDVKQISSTTPNNFTNSVVYTVHAQDDTTVNYTVVVTIASGDAKVITAYSILNVNGVINEAMKTIGITVPYGTEISALTAVFSTTGSSVKVGDAVQLSGTTVNNFIGNIIYRVTAADSSYVDYTVSIAISPNSAKAITEYSIFSIPGTVNESSKTINITVPYGTDVTALVATFTTTGTSVKVDGNLQTSESTPNNFTGSVVYRVTAADDSYVDYSVVVTTALNSAKAITSYSILSEAGTINETAKTINVTVPYGTDVTELVATFSTSGASVKVGSTVQLSESTPNTFSGNVIYRVTAADASYVDYTVTVNTALNSAKAITAYTLLTVSGTINESGKTIVVALPYGTNVTALVATFTTTGASIKVAAADQLSETTPNNFTGNVVYRVTAANSTYVDYTVSIEYFLTTALWDHAIWGIHKWGP